MELTREKAISECKKLWQEIKESGLNKESFLETDQGKVWSNKSYDADCPLCEYSWDVMDNLCGSCPLMEKHHKSCRTLGYGIPTQEWFKAVEEL